MKINVKATNITLTPAISDYIDKKVSMLEKFWSNIPEALVNIEVGRTTNHHKSGEVYKAEIRLNINGDDYYVTKETEDLYSAIDEVKDEVAHKITVSKKKSLHLLRRGSARVKEMMKNINIWPWHK